jgi:CHAT domain-containing protein/tetratricopeptide (TPR) repeat protein
MLVLCWVVTSYSQQSTRPLPPNVSLERKMVCGKDHSYEFKLVPSEFLQVRVDQKGADVTLKLIDTNANLLAAMDSPNADAGPEILSYIASKAERLRLEISCLDPKAKEGKYSIRRTPFRNANESDKRRVEVERLFVEGLAARTAEGQTDRAISKLKGALAGWQELHDEYWVQLTKKQIGLLLGVKAQQVFDEGWHLSEQGTADSLAAALKKYQEACQLFAEARVGFQVLESIRSEALAVASIAVLYDEIGEKKKALESHEQALSLRRQSNDKRGEAITLNNIGTVVSSLGEKQKALEYYFQAIAVLKQVYEPSQVNDTKIVEAATLDNIGSLYASLGENQKALEYFNQALPLRRFVRDRQGGVATLNNIGRLHASLGENEKALDYHNQALTLARAAGYRRGEASTLNNIGLVYASLNDDRTALDYYHRALDIQIEAGDRAGEAATTSNIGSSLASLGDSESSLRLFNEALQKLRQVGDRRGEANVLDWLQHVWVSLGNPRLAIFYGKQSVNRHQELRHAIEGLELDTQRKYLKTVEGTYRRLAETLIQEGRLFEAGQVLSLLKEEEYFDYMRRDVEEIKKLSARTDLRPDERAALTRYEQLAGKVTEYGLEFARLDELRNKQGTAFEKQSEYDDLKNKLDTANAAFRLFVEKDLVTELGKAVKKEIELDRALQAKLQDWGSGTVAVYTIAGEEQYRVILTTPKVQIDGKTEIKAVDLNRKIFEFRAALQTPTVDPRPLAKELYDILIKPIERDLAAAEAKTLLWSLDGTLRYVPVAALSPDGVHYLAEKYQSVVVTSTIRPNLMSEIDPNWQVLGAGVTKPSRVIEPNGSVEINFSALPGVASELRAVVRGNGMQSAGKNGIKGMRLVDDDFELAALENGMSSRIGRKPKYNVIHLATHFRLGGDSARSFLLLGKNQTLTLERVSDSTALNFGDVELVTLSACNTGFGTAIENKAATSNEQERKAMEKNNGAEVDSLATFIELRGARAVMATLWPVADESTSLLMGEFYRLKDQNPQMSKSEAMQKAQQAMITGQLKASGTASGCRAEVVSGEERPSFRCNEQAPFAHPYFWSPFILIGNWR